MIRYKNAHMNQLVRIIPGKYPRVDNSENISITERCTAVLVETVGGKDGVGCWHALQKHFSALDACMHCRKVVCSSLALYVLFGVGKCYMVLNFLALYVSFRRCMFLLALCFKCALHIYIYSDRAACRKHSF